ncbi:copper-translocating P-type ATPase [Luteitalea sp. TBR-22]|uniref:heavy metal translocating P-type ATPase n=1 Tax=Luteitalea sp. TBR-22 TaxID=2802971 RepID=UPI001AF41061|nr:cation-translocating P-type ATPase [Luteitalea sp. TBR-22]BCS31515.1 copper-translocating P-type ATPase [Luteitalea sp. TBR-22]
MDHRTATFHVAEMDCAHEVAILEKRLGTLDGIVAIDADVLSRQLRVHFDGATLTAGGIAEAVAQTGMRAWPVTAGAAPPPADAGATWRLVVAGLACLLAMVLWALGLHDWLIRGSLLAAVALTAPSTLRRAWQALRGRRLDIHVLMTVAVTGALAIDEWFEAATVLVLFGIAQALEARSLARARRAIADVLTVTPPTADVVRGGATRTVPVEQVAVGQTVSVKPGARVPLDGVVSAGESTVNQAPVTGEAEPVLKLQGDVVYAGSVNGEGALAVEVSRVSSDSTVARIVHQVERAHAARAQVQSTVDRFAAVYTPIVLGLAVLIAVLPPLVTGASWLAWIERALVLLVVACPCALVIATPVAMVSALSAAARRGLLIKGGAVLERLAAIRVVALDKTGTATEGRLRLEAISVLGDFDEARALQLAASLEAGVHHPVAEAIVAEAASRGLAPLPVQAAQHVPGRGASGVVDGARVRIGRPDWVAAGNAGAPALPDVTAVLVVDDVPALAIDALDHACGTAASALAQLRRLGMDVALLSGDHDRAVARLAGDLGIGTWRARLLPEDKAVAVRELGAAGAVLMVGDGINDGPALAVASVGLAMADGGTAVAIEAADGAMMHRDLTLVPYAIALGRATLRTVRGNVALALAIKVAVIALAAAGLASLWLAVLADVGASLLVVALGLRLLSFRGA